MGRACELFTDETRRHAMALWRERQGYVMPKREDASPEADVLFRIADALGGEVVGVEALVTPDTTP